MRGSSTTAICGKKAHERSEFRRFAKHQTSDKFKSSVLNQAAIRMRFLATDVARSGNVTSEESSMAGVNERTFDETEKAEKDDNENDLRSF